MGKLRHKWDEKSMKEAIEKVRNKKMSIREASERYSVPKSTLGDKVKSCAEGKEIEIKPCLGNIKAFPRTFNDEQEKILYNHVKSLDSQLMPLSKVEFLKLVYQYAEQLKINHRFNKTTMKAGKDFYYDFMKRHEDLRLRSAKSTSLQRASGLTPYKVQLEKKKEEKEERERIAADKRLKEENCLNKKRKKKHVVKKAVQAKRSKLIKTEKDEKKKRKIEEDLLKMKAKKALKFEEEKREERQKTHCIICGETFEEDWIQCNICKGWAHENCADLENNNLFYKCDACTKKK